MSTPFAERAAPRQPERPSERERLPRICCDRIMVRDTWPRAGLITYRCRTCQRAFQCELIEGRQYQGGYT